VQIPLTEGAFFAIPIDPGQFGVGLIARAPRRGGILLGYFFGPRRVRAPETSWMESRLPAHAVLVARFRDQALFRGQWPLLHRWGGFDRSQWPVPPFHRFDGSVTLSPGAIAVTDWRVEYGDDNLITPVDEQPAFGPDLRLDDDAVFDARSLREAVGARLVAAVPSADDEVWR
jgi:Immunity protein 26